MEGAGISTAAYREASQKYQHSLQVQEVFAALQVVLDSNNIATRQISTSFNGYYFLFLISFIEARRDVCR